MSKSDIPIFMRMHMISILMNTGTLFTFNQTLLLGIFSDEGV